MTSVILLGGGGHCRVVADVIDLLQNVRLVGISYPTKQSNERLPTEYGIPILADDQLPEFADGRTRTHVAVGDIGLRAQLASLSKSYHFSLLTVASPKSHISNKAVLADGCFVGHSVVVNAHARIGRNTLLNTSSVVEHDAVIGENCHIAPGAMILGSANIGHRTLVGAGAIVLPGITVGDGSVIGSGAVVTKDIPAQTTTYGVPARSSS